MSGRLNCREVWETTGVSLSGLPRLNVVAI